MRKVILILVVLFVLCVPAILFAGGANENGSQTGKPVVMRLAHTNPESDPKHAEAVKFAELANEKGKGTLKVEVYGGAVLGDWRELLEGLKLGTDEIVIEGFGTLEPYSKLSLLDPVPFVYRDYDHFMKVWNSPLGEEIMIAAGKEGGLKLFSPSYRGMRVVTSKKRFETVEQLKGLKIRAPGVAIYVKTWQALGAAPTPMGMTEIYTALQQGTVEAQENPVIMSYSFGFADVCKYLIKTDHVSSADMFVMDINYFNKQPIEIQQALTSAGNEAAAYISQFIKENEQEYLNKWREKGAEIVIPKTSEFVAKLDGFIEKEFPYLTDYVIKIRAIK